MQSSSFDLPLSSKGAVRTAAAWIKLGLTALVLAGIFSLLLVLARTPVVQGWIPLIDFFRVALVVHVNLSVLIWLLAFSAVLWTMGCDDDSGTWDRVSLGLGVSGTAIVVLAPFAGAADPQMSNYVPVLQSPLFFAGLILFAAGIASHVLRALLGYRRIGAELTGTAALRAGLSIAAIVTGVAFACVLASWSGLPDHMDGQIYYEFLFWGGGHVIQFSYTLLMMICWVVLACSSGCRIELTPRLLLVFLVFLALPIIVVPFFYLAHDVSSPGHRLAFTELMKYGGLSCVPLGLAVVSAMVTAPAAAGEARYLRSALWASIILFAIGGILGFLISGLDIVIPAHYHGATVGVTIAFMGMTYYLLPRLGYAPLPLTLAFWQPLLYGGGQLLHILGLAWTGGYGVQRKTAGVAQGVERLGEIFGMGLMGFGGLVSVIGGLLFLVVAWKSMRRGRREL